MKKIKLFFALFIVLLGSAACSYQAEEKASEIRAISYNIRYSGSPETDKDNHWEYLKQASINMIKEQTPTIMGVQEALLGQLEFLANNLPDYSYYGIGRDDGKQKGEFMAIFYKKDKVELLDCGTFWLSDTPDTPSKGWDGQCYRTCTWTIFKDKQTGKQFAFFNTHLDHRGKQAQELGLKTITETIKKLIPNDIPIFLSGDFNTRTDNPIYQPLKAIMTDSRELAPKTDRRGTYNGWKERKDTVAVDHIFVRGVEVSEFQVLRDKNYGVPYVSDHYPVLTIGRLQ